MIMARNFTIAGLTLVACLACGDDRLPPRIQSLSVDAKIDTHQMLREDLETVRHPSDGGGRAWLVGADDRDGPIRVQAGSTARFDIIYEAGEHGISEWGVIFVETSPFWYWGDPQAHTAEAPGYTTAETQAPGVTLTRQALGPNLLGIQITGRALEPGERVRITLGAGEQQVRVDRYAEDESRIWIAVDGDADGIRSVLPGSPWINVVAGEPARLVLTVSSTAQPGEEVTMTAAILDRYGNAGVDYAGEITLKGLPAGLGFPDRIRLDTQDTGRRTIHAVAPAEGIYRIVAEATGGLAAESNPLVVKAGIQALQWGDLHGHSGLSDGSGTPEQYVTYARDVSALDVVALTDHDHWGMEFLDADPENWQRIREVNAAFHRPGEFVTLLGYEWTSWLHGHRHVLYFSDEGEILSSMDSRYETPALLWSALRQRPVLTFAHHSAGGPISTNWDYAPDPLLEPLTEIVSVHGSSEAADAPGLISNPVQGNYVRDALGRGYRLGFLGSGDSHDGHPGLAHLDTEPGHGGLAAILTSDLTRDGVLSALRARSVYATNGPRIWLEVTLDGYPVGSVLPQDEWQAGRQSVLTYAVSATAPVARVELIRGGSVTALPIEAGQRDLSGVAEVAPLTTGEYLYMRVVQEDAGAAWTSPYFSGHP
jgi:hypothetical protein